MNIPGDAGEINAQVQVDFPYPKEKPGQFKTAFLKGTKNPQFNIKERLSISRRHTTFKRAVKNKGVKFTLIQKGGIFSSNKVIGSATVALVTLDNKCDIHTVAPIVDGRKTTDAKIEVKMRVRNWVKKFQIISYFSFLVKSFFLFLRLTNCFPQYVTCHMKTYGN